MPFQPKKQRRSAPQFKTRPGSFKPPVRGWIANEPLAASKPGGALILDNFLPTATGARVRGGSQKYATISEGPVTRMWTFKSGEVQEFFAADANNIFNITAVADRDTIPTADVAGQTSGYYSTAQFGTAGGNYLSVVNGTDMPKLYDASTWADHAFTGLGSPEELSFVWSFANRLWYVRKNTMSAYYLPVDSINGALTEFSLAGIFQEGGSLLFGGKWSLDSGDGLDDKCVFVSTEGEVAVYQGSDPSDANSWQKVGVYKITEPMGPNATMSAGGDLLIGVRGGIVPISEAVNKDAAALDLAAVTRNIGPAWKKEVRIRTTLPWEIMKWPSMNMMVVSLPVPDDGILPVCYVANLETGAWGRYTGWETQCLALFGDNGYFGRRDGTIHQMEIGGSDNGDPYVCTYVGLPDTLKMPGQFKTVQSARAVFLSDVPFIPKISVSVNYKVTLPTAPPSVANFSVDTWDTGLWDVARWDGAGELTVTTKWVSIGRSGEAFMPQVQVTMGVSPTPTTELVTFDVLFEPGGFMV